MSRAKKSYGLLAIAFFQFQFPNSSNFYTHIETIVQDLQLKNMSHYYPWRKMNDMFFVLLQLRFGLFSSFQHHSHVSPTKDPAPHCKNKIFLKYSLKRNL